MKSGIGGMHGNLLRSAVVATLAVGLAGCSGMPGWVNPGNWFGGDSAPAADEGQTPDLAALPDRPSPQSTPDQDKKTADSLAAAQVQAQYSADALRGGTEPPAPPPANTSGANAAQTAASTVTPPPSTEVAASDEDSDNKVAAPTPPPKRVFIPPPTGPAMPGTLPAPAPGDYPQAENAPAPAPAVAPAPAPSASAMAGPPQTQVASLPAPPSAPASSEAPTAPPPPANRGAVSASDAALGFRPSTAPPLARSVARFVSPAIVAHYKQTAANAGVDQNAPAAAPNPYRGRKGVALAGAGTLQTPAGPAPLSAYDSPQGQTPAAVIFFPGDSVELTDKTRIQVRAVAAQYKAAGAHGFVRVVGHSSSHTPDMSPARHRDVIFQKSQARAKAVAGELIRAGVPADKVLIDAVGDSRPVFSESMPEGEEANRRAEVFLQG